MKISIFVLDGVFDSGLSMLLDTLATANDLAEGGKKQAPFDVRLVGLRRQVKTAQGLRVSLDAIDRRQRPDLVLMPALGVKTPDGITNALERSDVGEACDLLRGFSRGGVRIAGACTATFVLAESGILNGARATTTWWLSPIFRERFPEVALDESQMIVDASRVVTAGAALAHVDLALWLVRRRSPVLAHQTARYLVFDARPSQAAFVMPDHLAHADPIVLRFEQWARKNLKAFRLEQAAKAVGASERTLERRTRAVLGRSPLAYVQDLRVETAVHRLQTTKDSLDQIAATVGYEDAVSLRLLLRKKTGRSVREIRALS